MNEKLQAVTANQAKVPRKRNASAPTLPDLLRNFNDLPDQAFVRLTVVLMLLGGIPLDRLAFVQIRRVAYSKKAG